VQRACRLDADFGIGHCPGFLKQPWMGVRVSLCLLTEDLATVWEAGEGTEELPCQPPVVGLAGNTAQFIL